MADFFSRLNLSGPMGRLEQYIRGLVNSPVLLLSQPARYILTAGGKRLRAALAFLSARVGAGTIAQPGGASGQESVSEAAVYAAAGIELVHAASLVHDDMIDQSPHRRGRPTIHEKWHHDAALLAGDYLFTLAALAVTWAGDIRIMECLAEASKAICEGEISGVDEVEPLPEALEAYRFKIAHKTAALFEAAGRIGVLASGAGDELSEALGRFGHNLGMAFQIVDDVLDYTGDEKTLGKPAGGDLSRGLITLPFLYAVTYDDADGFLHRLAAHLGSAASGEEVDAAIRRVQASSGPDRARADAERYRAEALQYLTCIPDPALRAPLEEVARAVVERAF